MTQAVTKYLKWTPAEFMLAILFLLAPLYYHPNIGGEGLRIPHNVVIWLAAITFIGISLRQALIKKSLVLPKTFWLIAAFPVLVTLTGFVVGVEQPLKWAFRMIFIWGGFLFFLAVLQQQLCDKREKQLLYLIVLFGFIHVLIGICQFYFRDSLPFLRSPSGAPYGLFQQVNNHATYLVTLIIFSAYLLTSSESKQLNLKVALLATFITGASFVVGLTSSRIGALTLIISVIVLVSARIRFSWHNNKLSIFLIVISVVIGFSAGSFSKGSRIVDKVTALDSGYSAEARLSIYKLATDLILEKPFFGHGIGSFPREFQNAKAEFFDDFPDAKFGENLISHPHNELFFWAIEGGGLAVIGIFITLAGVIITLFGLDYQRGMTYLAMLLPISLHLQVEVPFYVSALHWFLFLFIIGLSCREILITKDINLSNAMFKTIKLTGGLILITGCFFLLQTIYANYQLIAYRDVNRHFEKDYLYQAKINPYISEAAQELDMRVLFYSAMELNDINFLRLYINWAEQRTANEPKPYLLKNLSLAYFKLGDLDKGCQVMGYATSIFPSNKTIGTYPFYCQ